MKKNLFLITISLASLFSLVACKKKTGFTDQVLTSQRKGIFGKIEVYDALGMPTTNSGVSITVERCDTADTLKRNVIATYSHVSDQNGRFAFDSVPTGRYYMTFMQPGFEINKVNNYVHLASRGDSLPAIILAQKPVGSVKIDSLYLSADGKVLFIKKTVTLASSVSQEYGVVTHFFFGTTPDVSESSYFHEWISGESYGKPGESFQVTVKKSTDKLLVRTSSKPGAPMVEKLYVCAYVDNIHASYYKENRLTTVFPSLNSLSRSVYERPVLLDTTLLGR